jgi:hypothetical protein
MKQKKKQRRSIKGFLLKQSTLSLGFSERFSLKTPKNRYLSPPPPSPKKGVWGVREPSPFSPSKYFPVNIIFQICPGFMPANITNKFYFRRLRPTQRADEETLSSTPHAVTNRVIGVRIE